MTISNEAADYIKKNKKEALQYYAALAGENRENVSKNVSKEEFYLSEEFYVPRDDAEWFRDDGILEITSKPDTRDWVMVCETELGKLCGLKEGM